jgi:hypothetical protein
MRVSFLSNQYFWVSNIMSSLIALISINIKVFCILGIFFSLINIIILIFPKYSEKFLILKNNVKFGILGIAVFWIPIYIFLLKPDLYKIVLIYYILSASIFLGIAIQLISRIRLKF